MLNIDTPYGEISFGRTKWALILANIDAIRRFVDEGKPKPAARPVAQPQPRQTQPTPQRAPIQTTPFSLVRTTPAAPLRLPPVTPRQFNGEQEADDNDDILGVSFLM
jgi:hypothetical protein